MEEQMELRKAADEFLLYLGIERNLSNNTIRGYAYDLKTFITFIRKNYELLKMNELDALITRRYIQDQVIHHATKPLTLARRISCLKSFSKYCIKENWIQNDFTASILSPKADKKLPAYMKLDELRKLFAVLEKDSRPFSRRNEVLFKLLATSGMRRQEIVDLKWQQLDLENGVLRVFGKGKKERLIPLHPTVEPLLKEYKENLPESRIHDDEYMFLNRHNQPINARGLHRIFKELLEMAGLPSHRFSLHHLRHTFATLLLQNQNDQKVDLRTLQELLGHESLSTVQVYTHVDFEQKRKAIKSLDVGS